MRKCCRDLRKSFFQCNFTNNRIQQKLCFPLLQRHQQPHQNSPLIFKPNSCPVQNCSFSTTGTTPTSTINTTGTTPSNDSKDNNTNNKTKDGIDEDCHARIEEIEIHDVVFPPLEHEFENQKEIEQCSHNFISICKNLLILVKTKKKHDKSNQNNHNIEVLDANHGAEDRKKFYAQCATDLQRNFEQMARIIDKESLKIKNQNKEVTILHEYFGKTFPYINFISSSYPNVIIQKFLYQLWSAYYHYFVSRNLIQSFLHFNQLIELSHQQKEREFELNETHKGEKKQEADIHHNHHHDYHHHVNKAHHSQQSNQQEHLHHHHHHYLSIEPWSFITYYFKAHILGFYLSNTVKQHQKQLNIKETLQEAERNDQALKSFERSIALNEYFDLVYLSRGSYYLQEYKRTDDAMRDFNKALELNPSNVIARINRAILNEQLNHINEALEDYNLLIDKISPNYFLCYYNRAKLYFQMKEYSKSLEDFDRAIEIASSGENIDSSKSLSICYNDRALLKLQLDDVHGSLSDLQYSLKLNSSNAYAYNDLGFIYLHKFTEGEVITKVHEMINKSIECFTKSIELNPNYDSAYSNRAIAYNYLDNSKQAMDDVNKAIELNPIDNMNSYFTRAMIYYKQNEPKKAISDLGIILKKNPYDIVALNNRAVIYSVALNKIDKALSDLNLIINTIMPSNHLLPEGLGQTSRGTSSDYQNRGKAFAEAFYNRGTLFHRNDPKRALWDYNKAIQLNPDNAKFYEGRGLLYLQMLNDPEKGERDMQKMRDLKQRRPMQSIGLLTASISP